VDGLLILALAESGNFKISKQAENLQSVGQGVVKCLLMLPKEKNQIMTLDAPIPLISEMDSDTLRLALMNLIANAIRFSPVGGTISEKLTMLELSWKVC